MLESLFKQFDNILIFDVETTGFDSRKDEIIEVAALQIASGEAAPIIQTEFDVLVKLSPGQKLPPVITELTGISEKQLTQEGFSKENVCDRLMEILNRPKQLFVAYNAQFDLCFLYFFLRRYGNTDVLKNIKMLDALTVYKDRRDYPHKLSDAVAAYSLKTQNTHKAIDDAHATYELLDAMEKEQDDLLNYVNLFGYNPKYGVSGPKISSVRYVPQHYGMNKKMYEI